MPMIAEDIDLARRRFVLRLMAHLGVPSHEREDLAHQSLLRFYGRDYGAKSPTEQVERALLARISYSVVVDAARKRRPVEDLSRTDPPVPENGREEMVRWARELIRVTGLDARETELIERRFGDGWSLERLALHSNCHINTIRRRLASTLERLRRTALNDERGPEMESRR